MVEKNALRGNALLVSQYLEKWSAQICDQCKKLDELMLYLSVSIEASPAEMVLPRITKAYSVIRRFHKNFGENNIKIGDMVNDGSYWLLIVFSKHDWRREKNCRLGKERLSDFCGRAIIRGRAFACPRILCRIESSGKGTFHRGGMCPSHARKSQSISP